MNLPTGYYLQNRKYQLLHVVGQGGFGITYKGILYTEVKGPLGKIKTEVPISIKEYFFKDYCYRVADTYAVGVHSETGKQLFDKFREKLIKEAKILSDVHHLHIVNVLDVFEENNTAYIAMEYIEGHSLKDMLEKEGILPEGKVLKYIHQIGQALQFVHDKNILHLDIKPSNILIDKNDNARLIDFGVSKRYDVENKETSTTMLTLSKGFASIEQYDNEGTQVFSPCPDIYSLGATMYNLLTGKIPTESILRATRPLKNPSERNPDITLKTEEVILKAMQINPTDRFQTISEMMEALDMPPVEDIIKKDDISRELSDKNNDDITLLYSPLKQTMEPDDEQTVVNHSPQLSKQAPQKKKKKKTWIIALICIFALIGSSVALLIENNDSVTDPIELPPEISDNEGSNPSQSTTNESLQTNGTTVEPMNNHRETAPSVSSGGGDIQQPEVGVQQGENPEEENLESLELTPEERENQYEALLASGKQKMNQADFAGAAEDFNKAKELKLTEEVVRLSIANEEKAEERRVADRKTLYEEKMTFGNFRIVRKKSTGKYGAIDDKGEEKIPCRYLSVDIADEGRAFEREDKLFDIYNTSGVLVKSDVMY
ncbi:MAG: serine/threonine protein kinase [Tannerellaceae bacterium]|jgi:serine/threonine-protein kinase|nr:serine/threonine protein kinase [Tannerellaceae bacterium]